MSLLSAHDLPATSWGQMTSTPHCFNQTVNSHYCAAWKVDHYIISHGSNSYVTWYCLVHSNTIISHSFGWIFSYYCNMSLCVYVCFGGWSHTCTHCFPFSADIGWDGRGKSCHIWMADGAPSLSPPGPASSDCLSLPLCQQMDPQENTGTLLICCYMQTHKNKHTYT